MKPIELLKKHCDFQTDYDTYVLLAVSRKKDTPEVTQSKEITFREIIRHNDDIIRKYNKIKNQVKNYTDENNKQYPFYLYVSLNARDSLKAFFKFQHRLLDWSQNIINGSDTLHEQIRRTDRQFLSILASPDSRSKKRYFMIDYDKKTDVHKFKGVLEDNNIEIDLIQETKNGYHFKVKPFNRTLLPNTDYYETKTDAQLFVEHIKNDK